jgi:hypothetical protein
MSRMTRACIVLAAAPALVLAALSVMWTAGAVVGSGLWPPPAQTLAEAAATRNAAEIARQIGLGASPSRPAQVRASARRADQDVTMTPLEAAVDAGRPEIVALLIDYGAQADDEELRVLRCYTADDGVRAALEKLAKAPRPDCDGVPPPHWRR